MRTPIIRLTPSQRAAYDWLAEQTSGTVTVDASAYGIDRKHHLTLRAPVTREASPTACKECGRSNQPSHRVVALYWEAGEFKRAEFPHGGRSIDSIKQLKSQVERWKKGES